MKEMYKGKVNSPATLLVETIDSSVTSIKVADGTVFPEGPNVAVIGTDGNAETIKYESINGNILVGCVRGFQGKSSVWDKDTIIARNFTEYDLDALQENILELDKKQLKDFKEDSTHRTVTDNEKDKWNNPPNPDLSNYVKKEYLANYKLEDGTIKNYNAILDRNKNMNSHDAETCIVNMQINNESTREYLVKTYKTKYFTAQVAYSLITPFKIYKRKGLGDQWEDWEELQVAQLFDDYTLFFNKELQKCATKSELPTKLSQLDNDKTFKTETEIQSMIEKASSLKKEVVTSLPSTGKEDIIYLLKNKNDTNNYYTEYMWISGKWEIIGDTKVDLSDYAKKTEIPKNISELREDSTHRTVTDTEKSTWNKKLSNLEGVNANLAIVKDASGDKSLQKALEELKENKASVPQKIELGNGVTCYALGYMRNLLITLSVTLTNGSFIDICNIPQEHLPIYSKDYGQYSSIPFNGIFKSGNDPSKSLLLRMRDGKLTIFEKGNQTGTVYANISYIANTSV